jgi:ribosomal protein L15E
MAVEARVKAGELDDEAKDEPVRDPVNEEIHKYREEHARQFNFDLRAMQRSANLKVVRLPPQRVRPRSRSQAT